MRQSFFVGNSRLNCRIIESIFDMSLVYLSLHMLDRCCSLPFMSQKFAAFNFEFSFGYLENALLRISLSRVFEKDGVFFASNFTKHPLKIQRLFMENLREQRTNFDVLHLHYFCTILYQLLKHGFQNVSIIPVLALESTNSRHVNLQLLHIQKFFKESMVCLFN